MSHTYTLTLSVPRYTVPTGHIRVRLGSISPADGRTDPEVFLRVWRDAARLLGDEPTVITQPRGDGTSASYRFVPDATDVLAHIQSATAESLASGATDRRWEEREQAGLIALGTHLDLHVDAESNSAPGVPAQAVSRFLQHVFLAMNIAVPGSFSLYLSEYEGLGPVEPGLPQLTAAQFESAVQWAAARGWPKITTLAFGDVWWWLGAETLHLNLATEPWQKALFTLWRVSDESAGDPERLHAIAQALESLLGRPGVSARHALASGVARVLGETEEARRWLPRCYGIRSAFAHGSVPLLRPGRVHELERNSDADEFDARYWDDLDAALAVLLGVIQALAQSGARTL